MSEEKKRIQFKYGDRKKQNANYRKILKDYNHDDIVLLIQKFLDGELSFREIGRTLDITQQGVYSVMLGLIREFYHSGQLSFKETHDK